jgi:acylphosphatase
MERKRIRCRAVVHGMVQGVWFRDSTRREAAAHGVDGWVRNRPDGTVEAVLEGGEQAVQSLLQFLRVGPPRAHVARVDVTEEPVEGLTGFSVR